MKLWDVAAGTELRSYERPGQSVGVCGPFPRRQIRPLRRLGWLHRPLGGGYGPPAGRFPAYSWGVSSVAFSPDGNSCSQVQAIRLTQAYCGMWPRAVKFAACRAPATSAAFSPDGKFALFGFNRNTLMLCEVATGRMLRFFEGHSGRVSSVAFSPDGQLVLSGSWDQTLRTSGKPPQAGSYASSRAMWAQSPPWPSHRSMVKWWCLGALTEQCEFGIARVGRKEPPSGEQKMASRFPLPGRASMAISLPSRQKAFLHPRSATPIR